MNFYKTDVLTNKIANSSKGNFATELYTSTFYSNHKAEKSDIELKWLTVHTKPYYLLIGNV